MTYSHTIIQKGSFDGEFPVKFTRFLDTLPQYHYQQELDWFLCNDQPGTSMMITCLDGNIVASSLVRQIDYRFTGKSRFIVRNGPLYRDDAALLAHLDSLKTMLAPVGIEVRISPPLAADRPDIVGNTLLAAGFHAYEDRAGNYTRTVVVDLQQGGDAIEAAFSPALRRQIRKARKLGAEIQVADDRPMIREMLVLIRSFYRQRGVGMPAVDMLECYLQRKILDGGQGRIMGLSYGGQLVAGIIIVGCGSRAIFGYGFRAGDATTAQLPLTHLLHYEAIRWAVAQGYRLYDFGGYTSAETDDGINRFKLSFSGNIQTVSGDYMIAFHPLLATTLDMLGRLRGIAWRGGK